MSVRKLTANLITILALMGGLATAYAQHGQHAPVDPFEFDPDFQWFKPVYDVDLMDMQPKKRANYGWFATYDRMNLYVSRPELEDNNASENLLDNGWGNRYEIGYMKREGDTGMTFTYTDLNGPGQFVGGLGQPYLRLNRINTDELEGDPQNPGPPFGFGEPQIDNNHLGYNTRIAFLQDSENVMNFKSYELNKTWRMNPYHYGGILEPLVGLRWMKLRDVNTKQFYRSTNDPAIDEIYGFDDAEETETDTTLTDNEMLAAQFGFRYLKFVDRFIYSGGLQVFAGGNWQNSESNEHRFIVAYGGNGTGDEVDQDLPFYGTPIYTRNEEFFFGFDARGEVNYQLTKAITIRGGFQVIDLAKGIWRGGSKDRTRNFLIGGDNDQDVLMVGATFGFTINR